MHSKQGVEFEFWHGFLDYNYLSLSCPLIQLQLPTLFTSNDYNYCSLAKNGPLTKERPPPTFGPSLLE